MARQSQLEADNGATAEIGSLTGEVGGAAIPMCCSIRERSPVGTRSPSVALQLSNPGLSGVSARVSGLLDIADAGTEFTGKNSKDVQGPLRERMATGEAEIDASKDGDGSAGST